MAACAPTASAMAAYADGATATDAADASLRVFRAHRCRGRLAVTMDRLRCGASDGCSTRADRVISGAHASLLHRRPARCTRASSTPYTEMRRLRETCRLQHRSTGCLNGHGSHGKSAGAAGTSSSCAACRFGQLGCLLCGSCAYGTASLRDGSWRLRRLSVAIGQCERRQDAVASTTAGPGPAAGAALAEGPTLASSSGLAGGRSDHARR